MDLLLVCANSAVTVMSVDVWVIERLCKALCPLRLENHEHEHSLRNMQSMSVSHLCYKIMRPQMTLLFHVSLQLSEMHLFPVQFKLELQSIFDLIARKGRVQSINQSV